MPKHETSTPSGPGRLASLDAYRGFVMLLMMAEVLHFESIHRAHPESGFWSFLALHQSHIAWVGCTLHDLIQPSFSFLVGTALAFSVANRQARGQTALPMLGHAVWRALLLAWLGIFLRSVGAPRTNYTFEDTLTQIGLGYVPLFLLAFRPRRDQWIALGVLLGGIWLAFALWPVPGAGFDYAAVGVGEKWLAENRLSGFAAHWQKNSNLAWAFDTWFLNLFPRDKAWLFNDGGYATLSFVPTLGTMVLGLLAGGVLRSEGGVRERALRLVKWGGILLAAGWLAGALGICPVVKRIWTPSWVLFSGGWCCLFLAAFHALLEGQGWRGPFFPLVVIGTNSIAAYCIAHLWEDFIVGAFKTHLGAGIFEILGSTYVPLVRGTFVLAAFWLILGWMHRQKIFIRI
jgi:predicted acyltransferase